MKPITYLKGDATAPQLEGAKIIAHVCNDAGGWGKGFVLAISKRWPQPEANYRAWYRERAHNDFGLGSAQFVRVPNDTYVANLIGQHGIKTSKNSGSTPVRYEAIEKGLAQIADKARELNTSVHMPRIGCGLAGGKWEQIKLLIEQQLCAHDIAVYVYDFD